MIKNICFILLSLISINCFALTNPTDQTITKLLNDHSQLTKQQRVISYSQLFLGTPYLNEPLGEGLNSQFNQEPLYRLDAFDCQTYVSTILALALSSNLKQFQSTIENIDYNHHIISFVTRNHFPAADWIPNNIANPFIREITPNLVETSDIAVSTITIDKRDWFKKLTLDRIKINGISTIEQNERLNQLHELANQATNLTASIQYIPLQKIFLNPDNTKNIIGNIPDGAIILLIENNLQSKQEIGTDINVSHMGFVIWEHGVPYLRAASTLKGKVTDLPLISYLYTSYINKTSIEGIALYQII